MTRYDDRPTTPAPPPPSTRRPKACVGTAATLPSMRAARPHSLKPIDGRLLGRRVIETVAPNAGDPRRET